MSYMAVYERANAMLQCALNKDRQGWKMIRDSLPEDIKPHVMRREQEQRLMFKEYRYFGWCTVRPDKENAQ